MKKTITKPFIILVLLSTTLAVSWAVGYRSLMSSKKAIVSRVAPASTSPVNLDSWKPVASDPWEELSKVLASMRRQFPLRATGRIRLINNENGKLIEQQAFTVECADSSRSRYLVGSQEMICDGGLFLAIDHDNKLVFVQRNGPAVQKLSPMDQVKALFTRQKDTLQVMGNEAGARMLYSPDFAGNGLSTLRLYYDPSDYRIQKVVVYQLSMGQRGDSTATADATTASSAGSSGGSPTTGNTQAPYYVNRMEFIYDQTGKEPGSGSPHYYDPYIRVNGDHVTLTAGAAGYRLINALQPKPLK